MREHPVAPLAILGLGKLGTILLQAYIREGLVQPKQTVSTVAHTDHASELARSLGTKVLVGNQRAVQGARVILLCVKPGGVEAVCREIGPKLNKNQLVISVAASVPTSAIEQYLGAEVPVVRAMPNTPCQVSCGMTAISPGRFASPRHLQATRRLFDTVGRTVVLDEKHMNAVTGLSASGPAFIYIILESLAEAGVKVGLPRDIATLLASQTALGASKVVLDTGHHPALLKDAVTTPAGCTIDGILELEEGKLRVTLIKAVVKAVERAGELLG